MPKGYTRTVNLAATPATQAVVLTDVFVDADSNDWPQVLEAQKIPDSGVLTMGLYTDDATLDGDDVSLIPDGSVWGSFPIGNLGFRERHKADRPDLVINMRYPAGGFIEITLY